MLATKLLHQRGSCCGFQKLRSKPVHRVLMWQSRFSVHVHPLTPHLLVGEAGYLLNLFVDCTHALKLLHLRTVVEDQINQNF